MINIPSWEDKFMMVATRSRTPTAFAIAITRVPRYNSSRKRPGQPKQETFKFTYKKNK